MRRDNFCLQSMATDPTLDPIPILKALGIGDPTTISPVQGGIDTSLWRVVQGADYFALRVFRAEQVATFQREMAAMALAWQAQLPVPTLHQSTIWQGRPAMLLSWCKGKPVAEVLLKQPWRVWTLGKAFGRMQAQIHTVSASVNGPQLDEDWIGWAGDDEHLRHCLQAVATKEPRLLHLDYHPLNVLAEGSQITAVLDWANARAGDPRADVARTYTILRVEPYNLDMPPWIINTIRYTLAKSWQRGYEAVAGPLHDMPPFYAWAGTLMQREITRRIADPNSWWQPEHLEQVRRWTEQWHTP